MLLLYFQQISRVEDTVLGLLTVMRSSCQISSTQMAMLTCIGNPRSADLVTDAIGMILTFFAASVYSSVSPPA
jgi:hypothetical protein